MIVALAAPALFGAAALGIDYTILSSQRSALQQAADAAALASVKELGLSGSSEDLVREVGEAYANNSFKSTDEISGGMGTFNVAIEPDMQQREVTVNLTYQWSPFLAHYFDYEVTPISVSASAKLAGESLTCIVGLLQPSSRALSNLLMAKSSIHLDNDAVVQADGCAVYSNSTHRYGLRADKSASMTASTICSAGGVMQPRRRGANFQPQPITDCPQIEDPLIDRRPPLYGSCDFNDHQVSSTQRLDSGVYCGGLEIGGDAEVTLYPGVYVIKDGPLIVKDTAALYGTGITFFLTGENSTFDFQSGTSIDLAAMDTGSTAGLLFFEDRNVPYSFDFNAFRLDDLPPDVRLHKISSNDARNLLGTIYLPRSVFLIDADAPVADASAYTAIVTGRLWLREGPILSLNADLTETQVPVPDGLIGTKPALVK